MKKIFLGNLPFDATKEDIEILAGSLSCPMTVDLPRDRKTGKTRGFAFAEIEDDTVVDECIAKLKTTKLKGRTLKIDNVHENGGKGGASRRDEEHNER